jgi:hypothetical protein
LIEIIRSCTRDEGRSLEACFQEQASNLPLAAIVKTIEVSVKEKPGRRPCHVRFWETIASELLISLKSFYEGTEIILLDSHQRFP